MKSKIKEFFQKITNLSAGIRFLTYVITVLAAVTSLVLVLNNLMATALAPLVYALFAFAALTLSYSVLLIIYHARKLNGKIIEQMLKYKFTNNLLKNYGFRTIVLSIVGFVTGIAFGIFNATMGILYRSIWYGALAAYYIALVLLRGGIVFHHGFKRSLSKFSTTEINLKQTKLYRNCGIVLLLLNVALSSAVAQMLIDGKTFYYPGWTIFAYAAYAFYKITTSILHMIKAKKQNDMTVQAVRNINLAGASVSMLALQTALLNAYATVGTDVTLYNALTGTAVCLVIIIMGIIMIVHSHKKIKLLKEEIKNGR